LRIIIDAIGLLSPLTGIGGYTFNLMKQFKRIRPDIEYTYFYGFFSKKIRFFDRENRLYYLKEFIKEFRVLSNFARRVKQNLVKLQFKKYDIYFEPNYIPIDIKAKRIVTTVHDFSFYLYPEWHPKDRIEYFSRYFWERINKSDVIITGSRYIAAQALELIEKCERIVTIPYGYDSGLFKYLGDRRNQRVRGDFILFVGSIEPRKNLLGLLKAYMELPEFMKKNFKLVLVGFKGWENKEILKELENLRGKVEYMKYVNNEELAELYRRASCFIYPSLYEGFGLPPLEAMACGCPVVVSNVASLPEVCGDAAYYVDPYSVESIAEGIIKVLTDDSLKQSLIGKGLERAKLFSWEKSAQEHIQIFEEALSK
jgi:glycosyltransferase involved in cell wall biosynthesis